MKIILGEHLTEQSVLSKNKVWDVRFLLIRGRFTKLFPVEWSA